MSPAETARMRRCFKVAAVWAGWTADDQAEFSAAIRADLNAGDPESLACWQAWLEDMSGLERMTALCRAAEARIKAERKAA
jgi:hypothetical protein